MNNKLDLKVSNYIIQKSNKLKINSSEIKKGDVFIALKGENHHGNKFLKNALIGGAKYCITDKKIGIKNYSKKILLVEDIFIFLENLSIKKRKLFSGITIGITGSAGKTSLKELLKFILEKKFKVSASIKSYNNKLGVMLSILNSNINADYNLFEIGTNNFNEIKGLTKLIKPSQIFITNILSTHLENFKNKKNIAIEKSDIFNKVYNSNSKILYFQMVSDDEKIIYKIAKKQQLDCIVRIGKYKFESYLKKIDKNKSNFKIQLKILQKNIDLSLKKYEESEIRNIIFALSFLVKNNISTKLVTKYIKKFPYIEGRGSVHKIILNKSRIQLIDQSYNANPETMIESIKSFSKYFKLDNTKILLLGNMNELGKKEVFYHSKVINEIENHEFDKVILSGDLFKKALIKSKNLKNKYIYINSSKSIMSYFYRNVHKKAIIMAKCSNKTEVNKFIKILKLRK